MRDGGGVGGEERKFFDFHLKLPKLRSFTKIIWEIGDLELVP
jgi:hypothetical protein